MAWQPDKDYRKLIAAEIGAELESLEKEIGALEAVVKELGSKKQFLKEVALPQALEREGLKNIRLASGKGYTTVDELYVSVVSNHKEDFIAWLDAHGEGDIAPRTVNAQTVKSWYKQGLKEGRELPYDLVTVHTKTVARSFK